jgi:predicted O-methyltransferase YrrM
MIVDERLVTFINSLDTGNTPLLGEIEKEAHDTYVPIIRKEMQAFMKVLLALKKPARILEVGTAIGFSAIFMAEYAPSDPHITTIENYEKRIPVARANFKRADAVHPGLGERITLMEGDAADILPELIGQYDLIFMDAAKGQYINFMPEILRLLSDDGVLLSDNVLQDGDIIESRYAVTRRNRTIHKRMREYLYELTHNDALVTTILPVGDGITVSVKKGND